MAWKPGDAGSGWQLPGDEWDRGRIGQRELLPASAIRTRLNGLRLVRVAEHAVEPVAGGDDVSVVGEECEERAGGHSRTQDGESGHAWYGLSDALDHFKREILPAIADVPLSKLQRTTGLSLRYVSQIRRGEKTPHPKHWAALAAAAKQI
jgi:hypothetical protein